MQISDCKISAYKVPTDSPESDGTLKWDSTTMILVQLRAEDQWGLGYTYGDQGIGHLISKLIHKCVLGQTSLDVSGCWGDLVHAVRNEGKFGASAMAISAIDNALWDLKAKLLQIPLARLLGACRHQVEVYGSGGFTSYSPQQMETQMRHWCDQGIRKLKMKVGRHPNQDVERVSFVRQVIGQQREIFVDGNEAFNETSALKMAFEFARLGVTWFEQPISAQDLEGMRRLRGRLPAGMRLTTGEYIYNPWQAAQMIQHQLADVLQLDVTRCMGYTGFLKAAALCEAHNIPLSTHCAPTLHLPLGCSVLNLEHLEYFHDHSRIENLFFEGVPEIQDGHLTPAWDRPGLGLELKTSNMERYRL